MAGFGLPKIGQLSEAFKKATKMNKMLKNYKMNLKI
jgi:hypothetical protein